MNVVKNSGVLCVHCPQLLFSSVSQQDGRAASSIIEWLSSSASWLFFSILLLRKFGVVSFFVRLLLFLGIGRELLFLQFSLLQPATFDVLFFEAATLWFFWNCCADGNFWEDHLVVGERQRSLSLQPATLWFFRNCCSDGIFGEKLFVIDDRQRFLFCSRQLLAYFF